MAERVESLEGIVQSVARRAGTQSEEMAVLADAVATIMSVLDRSLAFTDARDRDEWEKKRLKVEWVRSRLGNAVEEEEV
ncbi:hypothetical protein HK101_004819 [Irineochytrium annulatum]|nr:hypothetical protein HK101_004819 [Irineochytrium annulatum]